MSDVKQAICAPADLRIARRLPVKVSERGIFVVFERKILRKLERLEEIFSNYLEIFSLDSLKKLRKFQETQKKIPENSQESFQENF